MISGIGIDVVSVERVRKAMRSPRFVQRVLTERERAEFVSAERVAGRWAAKEALAKAIPTLRRWHDVEVLSNEDGSPVARFVKEEHQGLLVHVSITHERAWAAAIAIVESD